MKIAIIESPCAPSNGYTREEHAAYLDRCIRWCVMRGYTPYASHKMLVGPLDDDNGHQRQMGIGAGLSMSRQLAEALPVSWMFFVDHGISHGMQAAWEVCDVLLTTSRARNIQPMVVALDNQPEPDKRFGFAYQYDETAGLEGNARRARGE